MTFKDLRGYDLIEINKSKENILIFENPKTDTIRRLKFRGLVFETTTSPIFKRVVNIFESNILGFKAHNQINMAHENPLDYKQIIFQMEGSSDLNKIEMTCVIHKHNYSINS